jgi:hypothetical protein
MIKRAAPISFRLAALTALLFTVVGLVAFCVGESHAEGYLATKPVELRKVEAGGLEIEANALYEVEFEDEGEAGFFFVPIRSGTYELYARGLKEKGTSVTINVK